MWVWGVTVCLISQWQTRSFGNLLGNSYYAVYWNLKGLLKSVSIWKLNANVQSYIINSWDFPVILLWSCNHSALIWDQQGWGNTGTALICSRCRLLHYIWSQRAIRRETAAWWELLCQTPGPDSSPQRHDIIHLCCPLRLLSGTAIYSHRTGQEHFWKEDNSQCHPGQKTPQKPLDITQFKKRWQLISSTCRLIAYQNNYSNILHRHCSTVICYIQHHKIQWLNTKYN